jgi:hypothetical protein
MKLQVVKYQTLLCVSSGCLGSMSIQLEAWCNSVGAQAVLDIRKAAGRREAERLNKMVKGVRAAKQEPRSRAKRQEWYHYWNLPGMRRDCVMKAFAIAAGFCAEADKHLPKVLRHKGILPYDPEAVHFPKREGVRCW